VFSPGDGPNPTEEVAALECLSLPSLLCGLLAFSAGGAPSFGFRVSGFGFRFWGAGVSAFIFWANHQP
jgi:hypothetical protein